MRSSTDCCFTVFLGPSRETEHGVNPSGASSSMQCRTTDPERKGEGRESERERQSERESRERESERMREREGRESERGGRGERRREGDGLGEEREW